MNAEKFFTSDEQDRIQRAVIAAEQKTAGEIVPMLVAASDRYAEVELTGIGFGLVLGTFAAFVIHDPWALFTHSSCGRSRAPSWLYRLQATLRSSAG